MSLNDKFTLNYMRIQEQEWDVMEPVAIKNYYKLKFFYGHSQFYMFI